MPYHIVAVEHRCFPNDGAVDNRFSLAGMTLSGFEAALKDFVCAQPLVSGFGYQQSIADHLERFLANVFTTKGATKSVSTRVSSQLNESADLALALSSESPRVIVEIEFRPNIAKDLVKFQIASNGGILALAVLIVALDRNRINASYTTMPEFRKTVRIIEELSPQYPLVIFGIGGEHRPANHAA